MYKSTKTEKDTKHKQQETTKHSNKGNNNKTQQTSKHTTANKQNKQITKTHRNIRTHKTKT